jgi:flagellar hook-associated protein 2
LPSNTATELIPGVTLDLKKITNGEEVNIEITEDTPKIKEKVEDLIKNINEVLKFIKEQNTLDESSDSTQVLSVVILLCKPLKVVSEALFLNG